LAESLLFKKLAKFSLKTGQKTYLESLLSQKSMGIVRMFIQIVKMSLQIQS